MLSQFSFEFELANNNPGSFWYGDIRGFFGEGNLRYQLFLYLVN
jgi:hypothetical protein